MSGSALLTDLETIRSAKRVTWVATGGVTSFTGLGSVRRENTRAVFVISPAGAMLFTNATRSKLLLSPAKRAPGKVQVAIDPPPPGTQLAPDGTVLRTYLTFIGRVSITFTSEVSEKPLFV